MSLVAASSRVCITPWDEEAMLAARQWHADPVVMEHLGGPLTSSASDALVRRWHRDQLSLGFGMLPLRSADTRAPIGVVGLSRPRRDPHLVGEIEIAWRLGRAHWGQGYATEAAQTVLQHGLCTLGLSRVIAIANARNERSQRLMERLGMTHDPADDFERPGAVPTPVVLYRASRKPANTPEGRADVS